MLLLLADVLPAVEAGTTIGMQFFGASPPENAANNQTGLNYTVLDSNTTLLVDSRPKPTGNSTDTSGGTDDPNLAWWVWAMIGGGFLILIVVLGVTAAFYSDYAKRLMGYNQVPEGGGEAQTKTGIKVIEVDLVHPCRPPHMMISAGQMIP